MQPVIVLLLISWVIGIALGAIPGSSSMILAVTGVGVAVAWWLRYAWPTATAVGLLLMLGMIYANTSVVQDEQVVCSVAPEVVVRVAERPQIRATNVRYVVGLADGCRLMVYAERWPAYELDDEILLQGGRRQTVAEVAQENEGYANYLRRQRVSYAVSYPELSLVSAAHRFDGGYQRLYERIGGVFVEPDAGLVRAMLLADQNQLPEDFVERWRVSGISHAISISGLHISLLTGLLVAVLQPVPLSPRWRLLICLAVLWAYIWFVGAPVSAVRAGAFWSLMLVSFRLGWLMSLTSALIAALVVFATYQPALLHDISLQLSVSGVVGIFLVLLLSKRWVRDVHGWRRALTLPLLVSLGATATTWPLVGYYFGVVSPVSLLTNLLIVPAVPLFLVGSILALATTFVVPSVALVFAHGVHGLVVWMDVVAAWCASLPYAWFPYSLSWPWLVVYYLVLALILVVVMQWQGRTWREMWE